MKASLFSAIAAVALFASTASFAAEGPFDHRYDDRTSKDFNYGYDRNHRVTPQERARWEAAQRNDNRRDDRRDDRKDDRRDDRFNDRNDRDFNYGYERNHRVTPQERARWETAHRYDGRR